MFRRIAPVAVPLVFACLMVGCPAEPLTGTVRFTVTAADDTQPLDEVSIEWNEEVTWTREVLCRTPDSLGDSRYEVDAYDNSIADGVTFGLTIDAYDGPGSYARDRFQPTSALSITYLGGPALDEGGDEARGGDDDDSAMDDDDSAADDDDSAMDDDDSAADDDDDSAADDDDDSAADDDDVAPDDDDDVVPDDDDDGAPDDDDDVVPDDDDDDGAARRWVLDSSFGGECTIAVDEGGLGGTFTCTGIPVVVDDSQYPDEVEIGGDWSCSELTGTRFEFIGR
jgi:hypothetical protein